MKETKLYEVLPSMASMETSESGADTMSRASTIGKHNFENMWEFVQQANENLG